jgi:hypothetical protein
MTDPSEHFQLRFAEAASALVEKSRHLQCETTATGLIIWAVSERLLEESVYLVRAHFPNAVCGKLEVAYLHEPEWQEPLVKVTVATPEDTVGDVVGDLNRRRGLLVGIDDDSAVGKSVTAVVPAAEMIGYAAALASMTRKLGNVSYEFAGYQPLRCPPVNPVRA